MSYGVAIIRNCSKRVVIVIGNNASGIEIEVADAIVENLFNLTGNMPVIKTDAEITEEELTGHNLILMGGADSNEMLEILRNPWNKENAMLLIGGAKAGMELIDEVKELNKSSIFTGWSISSDKFVFLEHSIQTHGELIGGNYRGPMIDSPTYNFDEETRTLKGIITFDV